ncbi:MAG: hypothetical protein JRH20_04540, partial [Deltaproteobacteria bacterium]|nr:hypothetical protein [Deltaproteobacteria bacterium]
MRSIWILLVIAFCTPAQAEPGRRALTAPARRLHRKLRQHQAPIQLPPSTLLSQQESNSKRYGDSWTCRESSRLLQHELGKKGHALQVLSIGQHVFHWKAEGWVSYHYLLTNDIKHPTLLLDPTASANFARDAKPGGLLNRLLQQLGKEH